MLARLLHEFHICSACHYEKSLLIMDFLVGPQKSIIRIFDCTSLHQTNLDSVLQSEYYNDDEM